MGLSKLQEARKTLGERVDRIEERLDEFETRFNSIAEAAEVLISLAPVFETATKLFKRYAPIIAGGVLVSIVSDGDKLVAFAQYLLTKIGG